MPEDKIGVIGICTLDGPVGPNGNHLRWSFPRDLGFPPKGFRIYRKSGGAKPKDEIHFSQLPLDVDLPDDLRIDGVELIAHPSGRKLRCQAVGTNSRVLTITPAFRAQLELRFPQPIAYAKVEMTGSGSSAVRAYQDKRLLTAVSVDTQVGEVYCAEITRLTIDLGSRQIRSIAYTTEADACNDTSWTLIKTLPLPVDSQEALSRFESGLKNYYAPSPGDAWQRYQQGAFEIVLWLKRLLSPTDDFFEDPGAPPHRLKIRSAVEGPASSATYLQSVFFLAALDPNIARLMSLYLVDAFEPSGQQVIEPPKKDRLYDYKVEGAWADSDGRCGLLLNLGPPPAPQPSINPDVEGEQLGGLRWVNAQPLGRVGLKWPKPAVGSSPQARAVQPVLYELTRFFEDKKLKTPEPILVDDRSWRQSQPVLYVDRDLALGKYVYEVRPIDLFGQLGSAIKSLPITVEDLEAPPPPIRARVEISQTGATADLRLLFEFGASQHQQAPDVKEFLTYWRPDTLLTRALVRVVVTSKPDGFGKFLHTLRMKHSDHTPIPVSELKPFVGDVLTNVITDTEPPLPANQRRRYRIAAVDDSGSVVLERTATKMTSGLYERVQDPHNRHIWTRLQQQTVSWREPISGVLREIQESLPVEILSKRTISPRPDPFASIPPEKRGRQFPNLPPSEEVVEVEINRLLTEPDVFAGGIALTSTNDSLDVIYVVSNAAAGQTRIALPAGAAVAVGDTLILSPLSELAGKVRRLRISGAVDSTRLLTPAGEIAFEHPVDGESVTVIMRVISNAVNRTSAFDLVVRADDAEGIGAMQTDFTRVRYYAPYVLSFPLTLAAGSNAPIALPIRASEGYRDGFIAVSATDVRNNEGPLGTPAQFSVTKPKPSGAPSKPYPCGMAVTAPAGYASPPNRSGRATICLTWETGTLDPADGARYEVARALDNSILAAHLRAWQMGKILGPVESPVVPGQTVVGSLGGVTLNSENGLIQTTFEPATSVVDPAIFRNGRLKRDGVYFQVTLAKSTGTGTKFDLLLRGPSEPLPSSGDATLEAPPNYSEAKKDITSLQDLALEVPEAFALVTGVPIEANRFTDDVAGKGRNVFFYRVRSVDAAENRSKWSPISTPFYQVDTSPPEAPREFQVFPGDRAALLVWQAPNDPAVSAYRIYRSENDDLGFHPATAVPHARVELSDLSPQRLTLIAGSVLLPVPMSLADIEQVIVTPLAGGANLLVAPDELTRLDDRRVRRVNPLVQDDTAVEVIVVDQTRTLALLRRPGSDEQLTVQGEVIDLSFGLDVAEIVAVLKADQVSTGTIPQDPAALPNMLDETGVTADAQQLTITGLSPVVPDGMAVVAFVRLADGGLREIRHSPGTAGPLLVENGEVHLDLDLAGKTLLAIREPRDTDEPAAAADLRLARASSLEGGTTGRLLMVKGLNPLAADGTCVRITIRDDDGGERVFDAQPLRLTWSDQGLRGGASYTYRLTAVKRVQYQAANGTVAERAVPSQLVGPVMVTAIDRSVPTPPAVASATWVDRSSGAAAGPQAADPAVRVVVNAPAGTAYLRLQRRGTDGEWTVVTLDAGQRWRAWPDGASELALLDPSADPAQSWTYRAQLRTVDDRTSRPSAAVQVAALREGGDG